jgi:di/tricarboxylate transporter
MTIPQAISLAVLVAVVAALIHGKMRSDIVALSGAAALLATRTVRPVEVQAAFASPAIIALAALFVIAYAMELSGLLGLIIRFACGLCERLGAAGLWMLIGLAGFVSAFLNNTPIAVLAGPVVRDVATSIGVSPKRFLIPLSYATVLGGTCTLIGTSTNLLVNDMARNAGQPAFTLFEVTPAAAVVAIVGGIYLLIFGGRLLSGQPGDAPPGPERLGEENAPGDDPTLFPTNRPFQPVRAFASLGVFAAVVALAAFNVAPIAALAFAGAVLLVVTRVISPEQAYRGLKPEVLFLIAGMVVVGLSLSLTGLASSATDVLVAQLKGFNPVFALGLTYGATLLLTEMLSNAAVAVLVTPIAVALAESLGVSTRPFLVAVMIAASAAFATPFGYQTNVLVYQLGRYSYLDFVRIGLPLNLLTWAVAVAVIPWFFPF